MVAGNDIEIENLAFKIGDFHIKNLSLNIASGEYFVLTGPNGAGKSVLLKLIAGLFRPDHGSISIDGRDVSRLPPWKRNVGYVPQDGILFPNMTVRENIGFGLSVRGVHRHEADREIEKFTAMIGIEHLLERKPFGLSGGERQKTSLLRGMIFRPNILLLDEPVSAIDEEARNRVCSDISKLQKETGITTLHISHNRQETMLVADRVGVLDEGELQSSSEVVGRNTTEQN